jgi:hypothetical protein
MGASNHALARRRLRLPVTKDSDSVCVAKVVSGSDRLELIRLLPDIVAR